MKNIKRIAALMLVLVMALSLTACHKKNEVAVTVGDVEFTSAYYMCALINADSEAKSLVYEELSDEEKSGYETPDYYSKKVEDKDFVEWVEDTAMNNLKKIAAYKTLCKENDLEIEEDVLTNAESYAEYYWSSYGYSAYYEPNGVGFETYKKFTVDSYYSELYFEHLYGEEGTKAIASEDIKNKIYENFIIADILEATFESEATDDDKATIENKINDYATAIKDGKMTFEEAYKDYNGTTEEETTTETEEEHTHEEGEEHDHSEEATESTTEESTETEEEETPTPKDQYASILGAEGTGDYETDYYADVKDLAVGEVKVLELDDDAGFALVIKQDIKADEYYLTALDSTVRHMIADDDYNKEIDEYIKKMNIQISKFAIGQFKVKEIIEPSYS